KVILYMTDDPKWHAEGGHEWLNSGAYSKYKGHSVNLSGRPGFGEFSYDNFIEVMQNYPKLGGFWIDNENDYWKSHGLYAQIRQMRPSFTLDRKSTRLNSSHLGISYAVFCLKKKKEEMKAHDIEQRIAPARQAMAEVEAALTRIEETLASR